MGCAGWALHKSLGRGAKQETELETELALHPLGQARWLWTATTPRSPDFSKWHKDSVEDRLAFYDACSAKLRLSHILLLFPGTSMVN